LLNNQIFKTQQRKKMKKIISTIFFIFFATSVFSAEPLVDVSWLNKNLNNKKIFILDIK